MACSGYCSRMETGLHLLADGTQLDRGNFRGLWSDYQLTPDQNISLMKSGGGLDEWRGCPGRLFA